MLFASDWRFAILRKYVTDAGQFALFVPVCMAEEVGLFSGLARSAQLSRGYRGALFLLLLASVTGTLALACSVFLLKPDAKVGAGAPAQTLYNLLSGPWLLFWIVIGSVVWNVANAMLYRRLRAIEEAGRMQRDLPDVAET